MKKPLFAAMVLAASALSAHAAGKSDNPIVRVGGEGKVAFVNACGADVGVLSNDFAKLEKIILVDFAIQTGAWKLSEAKKCYDDAKATVAVFIVRDEALPMSLVAMESKWGVVNAVGLDAKCISKEAMRVATILLGGACSHYPASVMRPAFSPADLAKIGDVVTFDAVMNFRNYWPELGIEPYQLMSRKDAEEEGLLPAAKPQ